MFHDEQVRLQRIKSGRSGGLAKAKQKPSKRLAKPKQTLYDSDSESDFESDSESLGVTNTGGAGGDSAKGVRGQPKADLFALDGLPLDFQTDAFHAAWTDWVGHRRDLRHPLTLRSVKATFKGLAAMGPERAIAAIQHSVANGWRGLFEPQEKQSGAKNKGSVADDRRRDQRAKEFAEPERPLPRL